jgi:hypothetical protein
MKRKIAVIPAIAYSIETSLEAFGRFGKAPHEGEENEHDSDIEDV